MNKYTKFIKMKKNNPKRFTVLGLFLITIASSLIISFVAGRDEIYQSTSVSRITEQSQTTKTPSIVSPFKKNKPESIKALYATMNTVGNEKRLNTLIETIKHADANAIVVDVKGSQGELIFDLLDAEKLVQKLHEQSIYVLARIVVFQDSGMAKTNPEAMIKKADGKTIWRDRKGFAWIDPAGEIGRQHVFTIAKRAIDTGFDEINYDYVRFPSDGDIKQATYPFWDQKIPRHEILKSFFIESHNELKKYDPDIALSIDIFGYTFIQNDDLGIGQRVEDAIDQFDGIYPMVYPSHYITGNFGFTNPAEHPYEVVKGTLESGIKSLGEKGEMSKQKIRPWLQVFDLGAIYTPAFIRAQIQATNDALTPKNTGWLMWDPKNEYISARALGINN